MTQFNMLISAGVLAASFFASSPAYSLDPRIVEGLAAQAENESKHRAAAKVRFANSLEQAQRGDAKAQYEVGLTYALPIQEQVERDPVAAFQWFMKSAQQGYLAAQEEVASRYGSGDGVERNPQQAFYWHQKAAGQGSDQSLLALASAYSDGDGVAAQPDKALEIYRQFANNPDDPNGARVALSLLRLYQKHYPNDHQNILRWMETSYAKGARFLGSDLVRAYSEGKLAPPNDVKVRGYLVDMLAGPDMKAADGYLLATLYEAGRGGPKELEKANALFARLAQAGYPDAVLRETLQQNRAAAERGEAQAQYELGVAYSKKREKTAQDLEQAGYWLEKAAQQGHKPAQSVLAELRRQPNAGKQQDPDPDPEKAVALHETLAQNGDADSQLKLYDHYRRLDPAKALHWLSAAAEQGHAEAQFRMGFALSNGLLRQARNPRKAMDWYRAAAEKGHPLAMYQLARAYDKGEGVEKDLNKALNWYDKAASVGVKEAAQRSRELKSQ